MAMQVYTHTDTYGRVLDLLENLVRTFDPAAPDDLSTRIAMILGEEGGIWPAYCFRGDDQDAVIIAA